MTRAAHLGRSRCRENTADRHHLAPQTTCGPGGGGCYESMNSGDLSPSGSQGKLHQGMRALRPELRLIQWVSTRQRRGKSVQVARAGFPRLEGVQSEWGEGRGGARESRFQAGGW